MPDTRSEYEGLFSLYVPVAIAVAVLVFGATFYALARYRRSRPGEPSRRATAPVLESVYAAGLAVIAAVLIAFTFDATGDIDAGANGRPGAEIDVTAGKWNWRFDYRGTGVSQVGTDDRAPTLVVPTEVPVRFHLRSIDVIHAFWIPERRFKRDAIPGRVTTFDLVFDHPGAVTSGTCAEFCGLRHSDMRFTVRCLAPGDFRGWLRRRSAR